MENNKIKIFEIETRSFPLSFNEENNTIDVVFSTGERVLRSGFIPYYEELEISNNAIDFSRLRNGAPVLKSHDQSLENVIGVVEHARIEGNNALATIRFSNRDDVKPIIQDIKDGILRNLSVGYKIEKFEKMGEIEEKPIIRATRWVPHELSVVSIPFDKNAQVRSLDLGTTTITTTKEEKMENIENKEETRSLESQVDTTSIINAERTRIADITKIVRATGLSNEFADDLISRGLTLDQARSMVLDEVIKNQPKVVNTTTTEDSKEKMTRGLEQALLARGGFDKIDNTNEFRGYSLVDVARTFVPTLRGDKMTLVGRALSTSDFPYLLANVANKSLQSGFETAPETWNQWTRVISVSDFKTQSIVGLSEFTALDSIPEGQEYKFGSLSEKREQFTLGTYGKLFAITRQSIVNDDLNALTGIPASMGRAAARKIGDTVYSVLTTNAALADGVALFYGAPHLNLTSGAPSVTTFDGAKTLMAVQKDIAGVATLNIRPAFILCPVALEGTCKVIVNAQYDPDTANKLQKPNMVQGLATVIADARLDAASTSVWYMTASPSVFDTIVVAFLDGNQTPVLEQQAGWSVDGTEMKVRIDCAAKAVDYRGMVKSSG